MKKQIAAAAGAFACIMILATGCGSGSGSGSGSGDENLYNYDLSEYLTLGQYKGIPVLGMSTGVTDAEVEVEVLNDLDAAGEMEELTEGAVSEWDIANIDYMGLKDGEPFDGGTDEGHDLIIGSGQFIPGFEEKLIGEAIGDTVTIDVTFPEDYYSDELAGQGVEFVVTVNSVKRGTLTEEYVQANTPFSTPQEYRDALKADMESEMKANWDNQRMSTLWGTLLDSTEVLKYPQAEMKSSANDLSKSHKDYATQIGKTWKDYLSQDMGMTQKEFDDYVQDTVQNQVGAEMIIFAVTRQEGLELTDEDYQAGYMGYLRDMGFDSDDAYKEAYGQTLEDYAGKRYIMISLMYDRIMKLMDDNAIVIE
ncbi:MAG: FKBP-type peptidyl-prolyl cis-trans isomerase [Clostridiales bacterium]|nr:FKBP-type peptidyl-prolyl cis-trans isomerase [Clostridiales bacterium]